MDKLQQAREIINKVDKEMAKLFCERMDAAKLVAEHKKEHGLPIFDGAREAEVIRKNSLLVEDEELRAYYVNYIKSLMDISKSYQHRLIEGARIAYSGVEGAFAYIAAKNIFPDGIMQSYPDFDSAYEAVVRGDCDCAVLPVENSYAGEVGQVADLMYSGSLYVTGLYDLKITHNLLGTQDASVGDIRTVISHPQALSQCADYIKEMGFMQIPASNTAMAAQRVANENDKTVAAIASKDTAKLYGLKLLSHHINTSSANTTRFAVFSRSENKNISAKDGSFILMFTVNNEAGALAKAINIIGRHGFNLKVLRSRPVKEVNWKYYFYTEAEGDIFGDIGSQMLSELSEYCENVKVAGTYNKAVILADEEEEK